MVYAHGLCCKHGGKRTCVVEDCPAIRILRGLCSVHLHPQRGLQSAKLNAGNTLATRQPGHVTVRARKLKTLKTKSHTPFPSYFNTKLDPLSKWSEVEEKSSSNTVITTTVPLKLPSGTNPYEIDVDSPINIKEELHQALVDKMAFLHRLLRKKRIYMHSTAIPYDETDYNQFPLKPRSKMASTDTCGWCINQKHYLFRRWCAQQKRCLTAQECKSSLDYAERTPPLNGEIFEFYFTGNAYLQRKERATRLKYNNEKLVHLSELAFAEYCISWDLKNRPQHLTDSHDRLDNDRGYTFRNTISNTLIAQARNKGTKMMRMKYRDQIQDEYYGNGHRRLTGNRRQKTITTVVLIDPKKTLARVNKNARLANDKNKKSKKRPTLLDSKGKPRNTLYGYPPRT